MKRIIPLLLLFQTTLITPAYDINVNGIRYNFTSDNTVAVTYISLKNGRNEEYKGDMVIPASIDYEGKKYAVTSIGEYAFTRCSLLKSVTLPPSIVSIGQSAFSNCPALESIEIPEGVKEIGETFVICKNLKSIVLPSTVTKISLFIIWGSDRVEKIVCNAITPPTITIGDWAESVVKDIPDDYFFRQCALRVPKESVEAYKAAYGWNKFCDIGPYSPDEVFEPVEPKSTLPTPTLDPRAIEKDMSEFLKLPTGNPLKWTYDDYFIIQRAFTRMASSKTLIHEGTKIIFNKDAKASDLNMSEELFNFIKEASGEGYSVPEASK